MTNRVYMLYMTEAKISLCLGFLITGGYKSTRSVLDSAEVFNPVTGHSCPVGDLPQTRRDAQMCNSMLCGGYGSPDPDRSCEMFDGSSSFTRLPVTLVEARDGHLCWGLKSGEVLLLGGRGSTRTTERISEDGSSSSPDFSLRYDTAYLKFKTTKTVLFIIYYY